MFPEFGDPRCRLAGLSEHQDACARLIDAMEGEEEIAFAAAPQTHGFQLSNETLLGPIDKPTAGAVVGVVRNRMPSRRFVHNQEMIVRVDNCRRGQTVASVSMGITVIDARRRMTSGRKAEQTGWCRKPTTAAGESKIMETSHSQHSTVTFLSVYVLDKRISF